MLWTVSLKNRNATIGLAEPNSTQLQTGQEQEETKTYIFPFLPAQNPILTMHCFRRQQCCVRLIRETPIAGSTATELEVGLKHTNYSYITDSPPAWLSGNYQMKSNRSNGKIKLKTDINSFYFPKTL